MTTTTHDAHPLRDDANDTGESVIVRGPHESDLFEWLDLYSQYTKSHGTDLTDTIALRLWSWLNTPHHPEKGFVAIRGDEIVGLIHFHPLDRSLTSDRALVIDDAYCAQDNDDVRSQLLQAVVAHGRDNGASCVSWSAPEASAVWIDEEVAEHTTQTVVELSL